jgi:acyl carrier protein
MYFHSEQQVTAAIANHLHRPVDEIESDQHLRRDLGLNNLGLISIALELEAAQQGEFPFESLEHVRTVSDLVEIHLRFASAARQRARRVAYAETAAFRDTP